VEGDSWGETRTFLTKEKAMTTIKTNGKEILVVELPNDATKIHIKEYVNSGVYWNNTKGYENSIRGRFFNCKIIGLLRNILESECEGLVYPKGELSGKWVEYPYSENAISNYLLNTAKESLISLLQSNGLNTSNNLLLIEKINNNS